MITDPSGRTRIVFTLRGSGKGLGGVGRLLRLQRGAAAGLTAWDRSTGCSTASTTLAGRGCRSFLFLSSSVEGSLGASGSGGPGVSGFTFVGPLSAKIVGALAAAATVATALPPAAAWPGSWRRGHRRVSATTAASTISVRCEEPRVSAAGGMSRVAVSTAAGIGAPGAAPPARPGVGTEVGAALAAHRYRTAAVRLFGRWMTISRVDDGRIVRRTRLLAQIRRDAEIVVRNRRRLGGTSSCTGMSLRRVSGRIWGGQAAKRIVLPDQPRQFGQGIGEGPASERRAHGRRRSNSLGAP